MKEFDEFIDILRHRDGVPSPALVSRLNEEYPFFSLPAAVLLQRGGPMIDPAEAKRFKAAVALNSSDPAMLYRLAGEHGTEFADFYGTSSDNDRTPDTDQVIDTFLDRYGTTADPAETALLERLIFNPVADYSSQLASEGGNEALSSDDPDSPENISDLLGRIRHSDSSEDFEHSENSECSENSENSDSSGHHAPSAPRRSHSDTTFSESLAKIYVRQHKYDKALEIISNLNLKYPEKSCYFADQMRFLQKLILNSSYK